MASGVESLKRVLIRKRLTLAVAESMTGGALADMITSVPGASRYFKGGTVAYSLETKAHLGVTSRTIERHGTVSREVAVGLAKGALSKFGSDVAIGITGRAEPDEQGPPGAWIAIAFRKGGIEEMVSQVVLNVRIGRNAARRAVAREAIRMVISGLS